MVIKKCSFCDKSEDQVKKIVSGTNVSICDECIELCNEIVEEHQVTQEKGIIMVRFRDDNVHHFKVDRHFLKELPQCGDEKFVEIAPNIVLRTDSIEHVEFRPDKQKDEK